MDMKVTFDIDLDDGIAALKTIGDALTKEHDWDEIPEMLYNFWDALDKGIQLAINMVNMEVEYAEEAKRKIADAGCSEALEVVADMAGEALQSEAEPEEGARSLKSRKRPGLHMYFKRVGKHVGR